MNDNLRMNVASVKSIWKDLGEEDAKIPLIGRKEELADLTGVLLKFFKPNALVIGEAGVGKTVIIEALAQRMKKGLSHPSLNGCRIFEIRPNDLKSGTQFRGDLEQKLQELIKLLEADPKKILFIDEIHQLLDSRSREESLPDVLKPALARGKFKVIGATTPAEYHRTFGRDEAFSRRFQTIRIEEPDLKSVGKIVVGYKIHFEKHYKIRIHNNLLRLAIYLAQAFLLHRRFPDKVIDLLDQSCIQAVMKQESDLKPVHLREVVARMTGVSFTEDSPVFRKRLDRLEPMLNQRVIGQEEAVSSVSKIVRLCKRRLDLRPYRPDGVFLFLGTTGVGKTLLAEALAEVITGDNKALIRLDMSEYANADGVHRLIGSSIGMSGNEEEPMLFRMIKKHPNGLLLLDEFEKADPSVHRIFLQVFDEGRLTDATGTSWSFSNITIIATANITADSAPVVGFKPNQSTPGTAAAIPWSELESVFPTELINRFDEIIPFKPLSRDICRTILNKHILPKVNGNLKSQYCLELVMSEEAEVWLLQQGYSEKLGARNLYRAFEANVMSPFATNLEIILKKAKDKQQLRLNIILNGDRLDFSF